jgi:hypothetical protein
MAKFIDFKGGKSLINYTHLFITQKVFDRIFNHVSNQFPPNYPDIKKASVISDILSVLNINVINVDIGNEQEKKAG